MQDAVALSVQIVRNALVRWRDVPAYKVSNCRKPAGVVSHVNLATQNRSTAVCPSAIIFAIEEHPARYREFSLAPQLQQCPIATAGHSDKLAVVVHQPVGFFDIGEIREVETAPYPIGRSRAARDDQGKLDAAVNVEQLSPVLERQTPFQPHLLQIGLSDSSRTLVGVKRRRHYHADCTGLSRQLQHPFGKHPITVELATHDGTACS